VWKLSNICLQYHFYIQSVTAKSCPLLLFLNRLMSKLRKPTSLRMLPRWIRLHVSYTPWFVGFVTLVPICLCASSLLSQWQIGDASYAVLLLSLCIYIFSCRPFHMITKEFVNCHGKALLLSLSFSLAWFPLAAWILCLC
jgi:hypothetical protein